VSKPEPDLSPLLPDDATLKARREALVDAVSPGSQGPRPATGWRRRGPRLALGAAMAVAAIAVALIVSAGGDNPPAAFAVEPQEGGGVTIKVYSLEDASGLEEALEEAGIRSQVTWLPAGTTCREPHFTPSKMKLPGGGTMGGFTLGGPGAMTITVGDTQTWRERFRELMRGEISNEEYRNSTGNVNLDPKAFRPDQSVVLFGAPVPHDGDPEGGSFAKLGIAEGPVEPCEQVPALPSGSGSFGLSPEGGPAYTPIGDEALRQTTIAEALRQTATAAEVSDTPVEAPPGPGRFLYAKTKVVQLQGWLPEGSETRPAGSKKSPRYFTANLTGSPGVRNAFVPTLEEVWTAPDGTTRVRETLGRVAFFSDADQRLWEEAGSPPPFAYDPDEHDVGRDSSGRLVKDYAAKSFRGRHEFAYLSRVSRLPTEPEALRLAVENRAPRLAVENRRGASSPADPSPADSPRGGATVERLLEILSEPITSPPLRAAAFNALAELPGIGFERDVADVAGRRGDAISWVRERGFGRRFIFDPHTSKILAEAEVIFKAKPAEYPGVPNDTVFRETAYLQSGIVDSIHETAVNANGVSRSPSY
jgi:hypothetical protein